MTIGEQELLPAVRGAAPSTLVIANGFSCREQISHGTGKWALHPVEVLALAASGSDATLAHAQDEVQRDSPPQLDRQSIMMAALAAAAVGVVYLGLRHLRAGRRFTTQAASACE